MRRAAPQAARVSFGGFAAVAAAIAAYVALLASRTEALLPGHPKWHRPWDHQKYLLMADRPFELRLPPFSWRIAEPLVVHLLPFGRATSFGLLAAVSVGATAVALHVLLRRLGFGSVLAWTGTLLFASLGWLVEYPLSNIWLPDPLLGLVVVLAALAAVDRRPLAFAALVLIGVLVKEQAIFVAPLWYTMGPRQQPFDRSLLRQTALLAAPALTALVVVRLALPADDVDLAALATLGLKATRSDLLPPNPWVLLVNFGRPRLPFLPLGIVYWTVGVFGVPAVLALADRVGNLRLLVRWWPFLAGVYVQPLIAANSKRLVALAFPVVVIAAVRGMQRLQERLRLHDGAVLAVPLALIIGDLVSPTNIPFGIELVIVAIVLAVASEQGRHRLSSLGSRLAGVAGERQQPPPPSSAPHDAIS